MERPDRPDIETILRRTLDDHALSRGERKALRELLDEEVSDEATRALVQSRVFAVAREALADPRGKRTLEWVEGVVKLLVNRADADASSESAVYFSPGDACVNAIRGFITTSRRALDVCVFTITDDRITDALLAAYRRRVKVRIVTDREKTADPGSDVGRLVRAGIPVGVDESEKHMHHKFAVSDAKRVLTGSYNWTRSAARANQENVVVSDDAGLVDGFAREFTRLWDRYRPR